MEIDINKVTEITRINLKQDDVLWIKVQCPKFLPKDKTLEYFHEIKNAFKDAFPNNRIILTKPEIDLTVISKEEYEAA